MRSFSPRGVAQDSQEISRSDVALEDAVLHIRALADGDHHRSSDWLHRPANRSEAKALVVCQLCAEEIGVGVEEDDITISARVLVIGLNSRSSGEFGVESLWCDERFDGMMIVWTHPDEAKLLLFGREEDADTVCLGRARAEFSVCVADQVMFLPWQCISVCIGNQVSLGAGLTCRRSDSCQSST